jgi:DNA modification methylase
MKPYYSNHGIKIYLGDMKDLFLSEVVKPDSIDLVLTDPPYIPGFEWVWEELGGWSAMVLKPGCHLFTLAGVMNLEKAFLGINKSLLKYWWTGGMFHNVPVPLKAGKVQCRWKPALWYIKGDKIKKHKAVCDLVKAPRQKADHIWQQSINWTLYWLASLTNEGDTVLDQFLGSGTTLLAAKRTGRKGIGFEIEEKSAEISANKIENDRTMGIGVPVSIENNSFALEL